MRFRHHLGAVLLIGAGLGCSSTSAPTDHDAQGSWTWDTGGALSPGNSFNLTLDESAGIIVGTGTYSGEAGPQGTLAANGVVANDSLRLRIVFIADPILLPLLKPDTEQFAGRLTTRDRIDGALTAGANVMRTLNLVRVR